MASLSSSEKFFDSPLPVGVVGASGYSGEELVRLLLDHPLVEIAWVTSRQYAERTVAEVFPRFASHPRAQQLRFSPPNPETLEQKADLVFLALPHGVAAEYAVPLIEAGRQVIDLSADFRLRDPAVYAEFYGHPHPAPALLAQAVYGLPETNRPQIRQAQLIASPGCYPTSVLLPVLPLLREGLIDPGDIVANALSGVSGAGRKVEAGYLFVECNESARAYSLPKHRHLSEMEQEMSAAAGQKVILQFVPHLIPVNRGILTTLYLRPATPVQSEAQQTEFLELVDQCYRRAYESEPFVRRLSESALPNTKHVTGTNYLELAWRLDPRTGRLIVISAEDNLLKGASGQAIQSMNIRCGFPETAGILPSATFTPLQPA